MYCTKCGLQVQEAARYCQQCGTMTGQCTDISRPAHSLMLSRYDKKVAGVCGGVARYLEVDSTFVRIIWLTLTIVPFPVGLVAYLIAWVVMQKEPARLEAPLHTESLRTAV
ncbi:MAG: PspC domain-containing protein [Bryobacteraceae bacterium]